MTIDVELFVAQICARAAIMRCFEHRHPIARLVTDCIHQLLARERGARQRRVQLAFQNIKLCCGIYHVHCLGCSGVHVFRNRVFKDLKKVEAKLRSECFIRSHRW